MRADVLRAVVVVSITLISVLTPCAAVAEQPEYPVAVVEGAEPVALGYGRHTTGAQIDNPTDIDRFAFTGAAGDSVRIIVTRLSGFMELHLEVWAPDGSRIVDVFGHYNYERELDLPADGTYLVAISDHDYDETGEYRLCIETFPPPTPPPPVEYDVPGFDALNHSGDVDFFTFAGFTNASMRIALTRLSGFMELRLEVWAPDGAKIVDTYQHYNYEVDIDPPIDGTYLVAISDHDYDETGDYVLEVQCLAGPCPPPPAALGITLIVNQSALTPGDTLRVQARVRNGAAPRELEAKTWVDTPDGRRLPLLTNPHFVRTLPAGADVLVDLLEVTFGASAPAGDYLVGARLIEPLTGKECAADIEPFTFTP